MSGVLGGAGPYPFVLCDVFSDRPFAGNQLAVFTEPVPERLMQPLAREINFSETVFLLPPAAGGDARARIFTPAAELDFAGHPVLGAAAVLVSGRPAGAVRLETARGIVPLRLEHARAGVVSGWMEQPLPTIEPLAEADALLAALGVEGSALPVERYDNGAPHAYVALPDGEAVARLAPDLTALAALRRADAFCFAGPDAGGGVRARMFAPAYGIPEDPATGSAAGPLAVHLVRHGRLAPGATITVRQGVEMGRPSTLLARAEGTRERIEGVHVGGAAAIVGRGEFTLPADTP
jgi:trans-2,3-dihydro-3-hydroxyanthranilate isomerase